MSEDPHLSPGLTLNSQVTLNKLPALVILTLRKLEVIEKNIALPSTALPSLSWRSQNSIEISMALFREFLLAFQLYQLRSVPL